jgi:hypothetical protein
MINTKKHRKFFLCFKSLLILTNKLNQSTYQLIFRLGFIFPEKLNHITVN